MSVAASTVDREEIERFSRIAGEWWDPNGKFKPLHAINPLRVEWIARQIQNHFPSPAQPLTLLDIGCGGGLIAEPMARAGLRVTAIDASEKNIAVAKLHAEKSALSIDYRCTPAEHLDERFDIVLALEIVEHVADVSAFVAASAQLLKPGGLIIYSTLNRTAKSFALGIVAAEYVLRWLPRGTHSWKKFLKPSELCKELRQNNIEIGDMTGLVMNPLTMKWELNPRDLDVNYFVAGKK